MIMTENRTRNTVSYQKPLAISIIATSSTTQAGSYTKISIGGWTVAWAGRRETLLRLRQQLSTGLLFQIILAVKPGSHGPMCSPVFCLSLFGRVFTEAQELTFPATGQGCFVLILKLTL